ncbi:beta-klotho [Gouania willdenowi]|uniref:Beta-klotho n=1 Tax=Gouania willdenowi TaxID=441366 RepID=A0A8C5DP27_GOUWI|nr:beta-klotho [Gouania willdenowi]
MLIGISRCQWLLHLLMVCGWHEVFSLLGEGRNIWQQPKPGSITKDQQFLHDTFPPGFLWGSGTSAFQTEGAWDKNGKGASIWDHFTHNSFTGNMTGDTADVASDSYNHWKEDIEALHHLNVGFYSFSLSWPRLFPNGSGQPNAVAVKHYTNLLKKLQEKKIKPVVTLHHWDLPQVLQEQYGGWKNSTLLGLFEEYAAFCFHTFGRDVRYWITMHNPYLMAVQGYETGVHAPGEMGGTAVSLIVAHNLIRAHAKAWHIYNTNFRPTQGGKVSIVLGSHWVEPQRGQPTPAKVDLCQESIEAVLGWFASPIFGDGDYPASLKSKHGSLLPMFTPEEKIWVQKTADFFALSFGPNNLRLGRDLIHYGQTVTPDLRRLLSWIRLEYGDLKVLIAEGGWFSESSVGREDTIAIYLMKSFINQVLQAIRFDGVQVFGYTAWSLVDGYEWNYGYTVRRGLFYVDFSQPNRTRNPKTSAQYYRLIITKNGFPQDESADVAKGHFPCTFHWGIADSTLEVRYFPFSPQFTDPYLYTWNLTGDGSLHPVPGVELSTRQTQCTDYLAINGHLRLLSSIGVSHYRFALNWSLILPQGDHSVVNTEALRYYRCVLKELSRLNVEPVVIIYYPKHQALNMGLPVQLYQSGGWLNESTVEAFQQYAELCYQELGTWVQYWITINEPNRLADIYTKGKHQASHNLLMAHAKAWRLYERKFYSQQRAKVSLALHADWAIPANFFLESHTTAAERFLLFELGRFLDPLIGPEYVNKPVNEARVMDLPESSPLSFTPAERKELKGALDFIALNHFTTRLVSPHPSTKQKTPPDPDYEVLSDPTWPSSRLGQAVVPWGFRRMLSWVTMRYGGTLPIIVTGSGVDDQAPAEDVLRQYYLRSYLKEALKAIHLDGVNLQGFYMWKLQDRHNPQFGLFSSIHHQSKAKASVAVYREFITNRGFSNNDTVQPCRLSAVQELCSVCSWMFRHKAVLVFGGCLLLTLFMMAALIIFVIITKKNGMRGRERRKSRRNRRRRKEGPIVCLCPSVDL